MKEYLEKERFSRWS